MAWPESPYKSEYCAVAAKILAQGKSLAAVCAELDICRATLYNWRDAHLEFANAINAGLQKAQAEWEEFGREGMNGDIKNFGASPWIFTMKNRFREDYQEEKDSKDSALSLAEKILDKLVDN